MSKLLYSTGFHRKSTLVLMGVLAIFNCLELQGQSLSDTIDIKEISVISKEIKRFQAGAKVETISGIQFENFQDGNLETLLSRNIPVSLKGTAGGLSTIRFRGTSPDHTSINFGGLNLNSLTLGHSNISNVSIYLFDEIGLQFGSSSAVNGSGSIGGAIYLGLQNDWTNGFKAELKTSFGSFGEQLHGSKIYFGNGSWESVTRVYYLKKENNFPFYNTSFKDFTTGKVGLDDEQKNANIENKGFLQEFNYRFSKAESVKLKVWLENNWHYIQQNQASNLLNPEQKETYEDEHIRIWADYDNKKKRFKYHFGVGYVFDNGIFNETPNPISTQRIVGDFYLEQNILKNGSYKVGAKAARMIPKVYAYSQEIKFEDRTDLFLSYNHHFFNRLRITLNLRQGFVTDFKLPFVPALGLSYQLLNVNQHLIKLNANVAKSYRVPTFNDRYWEPGGNPNLKPEDGMNYEIGLSYNYYSNNLTSSIKLNGFYMDVDNWLLWRNGGSYWYADNVQRVQSKGIEISGNLKYNWGRFKINSIINYAFTNAERVESINHNSAINRQLEYVPLHKGITSLSVAYKEITFLVDGSYSYEQYTDETMGNILDSYFLLNAALNYRFKINDNHKFKISTGLNNILNKNYQSTIDYAMPQINYKISLTYNFK